MAYLWCWPAWRPAYGAETWSGINSRGASWYCLNPVWFLMSYKVQYHQSSCRTSHPRNVCLIIPRDESSTTGTLTTYWYGNALGLEMKWADLLLFHFFICNIIVSLDVSVSLGSQLPIILQLISSFLAIWPFVFIIDRAFTVDQLITISQHNPLTWHSASWELLKLRW